MQEIYGDVEFKKLACHLRHDNRDSTGCFLKRCGSLLHDATNDDSPLFNLPVCKKVWMETFLERQAITKFTKYLCHACVEEAEINSSSYFIADKAAIERSDQEKCPGEDVLQENLIEESSTQSSLTKSCIEIGTMLDNLIKDDISNLYNEENKCSINQLLAYNAEKWLDERPPEFVNLIRSLCGRSCQPFKVANAIEYIYGCRNSKLVLPLSFQENILIYSLSRSKTLVSYSGKLRPSGSYDYMAKWMSEQALDPIDVPMGVVRSVFDNKQAIDKTYQVRAENKVPMSRNKSYI